ncbi:MAG: phosphotransferase [Sphingomonadaceae bacterium]
MEGSGEVTQIRSNARFDECALERWMQQHVEGFHGPLEVSQFAGGQSNPTFLLKTPSASYVMRRKPPGKLLKGAHAVDREARVAQALETAGFPVAHIHVLCTDDAVIGSWFYIMDLVEGRIFWDATFPDLSPQDRAACFDAMNETQARLHSLDPDALGLTDYGRHGGYFERQVRLWTRQYQDDPEAGRYPDMDFLGQWLSENIPEDGLTRIVHGDFRCDNLMFHPQEPKIVAVLDWELSTLGDPLVDFAYHLMMYRVPSWMPWGLADRDLGALGLPDENTYIARYCERTGRSSTPDISAYLVLNLFRFAAIVHGIKGRMIRGNAASAEAGALVERLEDFAAIGRSIAEGRQ